MSNGPEDATTLMNAHEQVSLVRATINRVWPSQNVHSDEQVQSMLDKVTDSIETLLGCWEKRHMTGANGETVAATAHEATLGAVKEGCEFFDAILRRMVKTVSRKMPVGMQDRFPKNLVEKSDKALDLLAQARKAWEKNDHSAFDTFNQSYELFSEVHLGLKQRIDWGQRIVLSITYAQPVVITVGVVLSLLISVASLTVAIMVFTRSAKVP